MLKSYAVFGDNPPPIVVESCTFVNFPSQSAYQSAAIGLRSTDANGAITSTPPVMVSRTLFDASFTNAWPLARFENAGDFPVTMTDCILPSEQASPDFMPDVTNNMHIVTSQVAWAGFPLADSPVAALGVGAFAPLADDPLADMDGDTLSDYDEVYVHGTDPILADSDNDGMDDGDEIYDGTDPSDPHFFLQRLTVTVTNTASLAYPVRVAWGYSPTGWETNGVAVFPQGFGTKAYTNEASQVTRYARAFCDFNDDGEYDAGNDILLVRAIPNVGTARIDFVFGDVDGDGLSDYDEIYTHGTDPLSRDTDGDGVHDGDELSEGTDPTNPHSFAQIQYVSVTNTTSLVHSVYLAWGYSDTGWEANGLFAFPQGFGTNTYHDASIQGASHIKAFCDLNDNGRYDADDDILIVRSIPDGRTAYFSFIFGDVDHDGVPDAQERQEGTDPYDANNFRLKARFRFTDHDVGHGCTNFVAVSLADSDWNLSDVVMRSAAGTFEYSVDTNVTGGAIYVKCLHDRDGDGLLDVGLEGIRTNQLFRSVGTDTPIEVSIGDYDYDGVPDSVELDEGTDPFNGRNYCFNLSLTYTGVFQTTNALTFAASFGTNRVYGPCVVEGNVWSNDFGHRSTTTGEHVSVDVWDDMNQNGEWDSGETSNKYVIAVTGHNMVMTNKLAYKNFDRNYNELPDWWEEQEGLDADGVARRMYDDPDGDGLINLHEFWCGTHPLVPDGSNTLLSVVARSIDDRIKGKVPDGTLQKFFNYEGNGASGIFDLNTNCWANGIDTSCVSMWNSFTGRFRAGVAISRRHIMLANHYPPGVGAHIFFREPSGNIHTNTIADYRRVDGTDILIGVLHDELPNTITPACVLPSHYRNYIGSGKGLPVLRFDQYEQCIVCEVTQAFLIEMSYLDSTREKSFATTTPSSGDRQAFYIHAHGGDSGNPSFIVVGNEVVLLGCLHGGVYDPDGASVKVVYSPFVQYYVDAIQSAMDSLLPGYSLRNLDCSSYQELVRKEGY